MTLRYKLQLILEKLIKFKRWFFNRKESARIELQTYITNHPGDL